MRVGVKGGGPQSREYEWWEFGLKVEVLSLGSMRGGSLG